MKWWGAQGNSDARLQWFERVSIYPWNKRTVPGAASPSSNTVNTVATGQLNQAERGILK